MNDRPGYQGRIRGDEAGAARHYAELAVTARNGGRGFPTPDGYTAAIAAAKGFIVATRDTSPFEAAGLKVINPWEEARKGEETCPVSVGPDARGTRRRGEAHREILS